MRIFISIGLTLKLIQEKLAKTAISIVVYGSKKWYTFILCIPLLFAISFVLGAFCVPLGIYNGLLTTIICLKRYADELLNP